MDDTHQSDENREEPPVDAPAAHPAEVLAATDPADAPDLAEEMADRLVEELDEPQQAAQDLSATPQEIADGSAIEHE